jgi:apolipoprotein D and lipocalin family protein
MGCKFRAGCGLLLLVGSLLFFWGCSPTANGRPPLETVGHVDLRRYAGTWYEIASFPARFQEGCVATRAEYTLRSDGLIRVVNQCRRESLDGPLKTATGLARAVNPPANSRLKVSFFRPFWGDYWIIDLDPAYQWAVIGHPSRDYLWILSRTPRLDEAVYRRLLEHLPAQGYDPGRLRRTLQP